MELPKIRSFRRAPASALRVFLRQAAAGDVLLFAVAVAAMVLANSALSDVYQDTLHTIGAVSLPHWITNGLMALFFLLVGLEIKRELVGHLASWDDRTLPSVAALGGRRFRRLST